MAKKRKFYVDKVQVVPKKSEQIFLLPQEYLTYHSLIVGTLKDRMVDYLALNVLGGQLDEILIGGMTRRKRIEIEVQKEFGTLAMITFPDPRSVVLKCGKYVAEIRP